MTWQTGEILDLPTKEIDGGKWVQLDSVLDILNRQCKACAFYERRTEQGANRKRSVTYEYCTNAKNKWESTERLTNGNNRGCARFKRAIMEGV